VIGWNRGQSFRECELISRAPGNSRDMGTPRDRNIEEEGPAETGEQPFLGLESSRATSLGSEDDSSNNNKEQMEVRSDSGKRKVSLKRVLGLLAGSNWVEGTSEVSVRQTGFGLGSA
jgi:hypothetical protein